MAKAPKSQENVTPPSLPTTTPNFNQHTHDFTLQIVVDMQKTLGALDAKVDRLITDVSALDTRVSTISHRIAWIAGGAAAIGAIVGAALVVGNSVPWDRVTIEAPAAATKSASTSP